MKTAFTKNDIGCYGNGAFGHDHIRTKLAELLQENTVRLEGFYIDPNDIRASINREHVADAIKALADPMSDDASEEEDAIDWLNTLCDGVYFTFEDGDLLLIEENTDV